MTSTGVARDRRPTTARARSPRATRERRARVELAAEDGERQADRRCCTRAGWRARGSGAPAARAACASCTVLPCAAGDGDDARALARAGGRAPGGAAARRRRARRSVAGDAARSAPAAAGTATLVRAGPAGEVVVEAVEGEVDVGRRPRVAEAQVRLAGRAEGDARAPARRAPARAGRRPGGASRAPAARCP